MPTCTTKILGGSTIAGSVAVTGSVSARPGGLTKGFIVLFTTVNDTTWTLLPQTTLREHITIQNLSGFRVSLNSDYFIPLPADDFGYFINSGNEANFAASDTVKFYAKSASGSGTITLKTVEMA